MEIFATIVMLVWIPVVLVMFAVLPPQRAVIVAFLCAWLFLPMASYKLPFLPDYTKMSATCAGIFMGALLFDAKRLLRFSPRWIDLPVGVLCVSPFISSMVNRLGVWDGVSVMLNQIEAWGMPYLIGRIYFTDGRTQRELAVAMFVGGLLYVPLCLFEIRMSPKLHLMLYGFAGRESQVRFGGWRPNVFMDGGLQVGLWMAATSLIGIWLCWTGALKKVWGVSAGWLVFVLVATTILCRSTGALVLLIAGLGAMGLCLVTRNRLALVCLILVAPVYILLRTTGAWSGEQLVTLSRSFDQDRGDSLEFRLKNENILIAKALYQPIFGWGGWGRSRVHDEWEKDISITDGRWIIELGSHGIVGAASCFATMLLPLILLTSRFPARRLVSREIAPALTLAVVVTIYAIDSLPNAMANPVFVLSGGAVVGFVLASWKLGESGLHPKANMADGPNDSIPLRRLHPGSV